MTVDLEDRLRDTFERVMPLLYDEPTGDAGGTGPGSVVLIGSAARPPRGRTLLVAACVALVIATVAVIAVVRGGRDDVTPANNGPETSTPSVPTSGGPASVAAPVAAGAPEWYGWIKPFLPAGFDHVAMGTNGPSTLYYTAINVETDQALHISILGDPNSIPSTAPVGELTKTNDGYAMNVRSQLLISVQCGFGSVLVSYTEGGDFCDAGVPDLVRRNMTADLAANFPFDVLDPNAGSETAPVDMDAVLSLMTTGFPDLSMTSSGEDGFEQFAWFGPPPANTGVVVGATATVIDNVFPADDGVSEPSMHQYGELAVGWSIRDGVAVRLFTSHVTKSIEQQASLLDQLATLARYTATLPSSTTTLPPDGPTTSTLTTTSTVTMIGTTVPDIAALNEVTYTVHSGDILVGIARWFCVTAQELVDANGWSEGFDHSLAPGDVIRVPGRACVRGLPAPTEPTSNTVLVAGDSIGIVTAAGLVSANIGALNEGRVSTGIVRADFFDWPAHLADRVPTLPAGSPVVFAAGGNDGQAFLGTPDSVGSEAWVAEYTNRVLKIVDLVVGADHPLIWIGPPVEKDPAYEARLDVVRSVTEATLAGVRGVVYVDAAQILAGPDGGYTETLADLSGSPIVVRSTDDNRITPAGQDLITQRVLLALQAQGFSVMNVDAFGTYTVQAGDYLGGIAAKSGTTVDGIIAVNGWTEGASHVLNPGDKIRLPAKADDPPVTEATGLPTTTVG